MIGHNDLSLKELHYIDTSQVNGEILFEVLLCLFFKICLPASLFTWYVYLNKLLHFSGPRFPIWGRENNNATSLTGLFLGGWAGRSKKSNNTGKWATSVGVLSRRLRTIGSFSTCLPPPAFPEWGGQGKKVPAPSTLKVRIYDAHVPHPKHRSPAWENSNSCSSIRMTGQTPPGIHRL